MIFYIVKQNKIKMKKTILYIYTLQFVENFTTASYTYEVSDLK